MLYVLKNNLVINGKVVSQTVGVTKDPQMTFNFSPMGLYTVPMSGYYKVIRMGDEKNNTTIHEVHYLNKRDSIICSYMYRL